MFLYFKCFLKNDFVRQVQYFSLLYLFSFNWFAGIVWSHVLLQGPKLAVRSCGGTSLMTGMHAISGFHICNYVGRIKLNHIISISPILPIYLHIYGLGLIIVPSHERKVFFPPTRLHDGPPQKVCPCRSSWATYQKTCMDEKLHVSKISKMVKK